MTAAVRPAPRPVATRPAPARGVQGRPPHPPAGRVHHEPQPPAHSTAQRLMIGGGILAVVAAVAVLYAFGSARNLSGVPLPGAGAGSGAGDGRASMETTTLYRDMRDGRVMVMEMDRNGTRIVGIRPKEDIPMAGDMYRDRQVRTMQTPSASDRVNALGSAFR